MLESSKWNLRSLLFFTAFILLIAGGILFSLQRVQFKESISSILPANDDNEFLIEVIDSARFFDRIVFHIYNKDSNLVDPDKLVTAASSLSDSIEKLFIPDFIEKTEGMNSPSLQSELIDNFYNYLPFYLDEEDYYKLDSIIEHGDFNTMMEEFIKILNSPAGFMAAPYFFRDPLGLSMSQLTKLRSLQLDENLILYRNFLFTSDQKHLLLFVTPADAKNTGKNKKYIDQLDQINSKIISQFNHDISIEYIGSLPVATANAQRIKKDVKMTVSIALIIIIFLIYYFFRRKAILGIIILPALFGATVSLFYFGIKEQNISLISLGIGSIILGITVDYTLHLITHLKHQENIRKTLKKVTLPILMSSITTAAAFLCLTLLSSPALKQLGIFAAISVIAAAILTVTFIPLIVPYKSKNFKIDSSNLIEKLAGFKVKNRYIILLLLILITVLLFIFSKKVTFETDIEKSNYMPSHLSKSLENLHDVTEVYQKKIYLLSRGETVDDALYEMEQRMHILEELKDSGLIENYHGVYSLVLSTSRQKKKIDRWSSFWTNERKQRIETKLDQAASEYGIKIEAFSDFYAMLDHKFEPVLPSALFASFSALIGDFNIQLSEGFVVPTIISISGNNKNNEISYAFEEVEYSLVLDRKVFFNQVFELIEKDFNRLIKISLVLVFIILLLFFGRIEMALITFLPIVVSWIWTLGISGLTGLKLNYFNIIICTLIFGLGVDYSIFVTKGLLHKYKYGSNDLLSYKSSIIVSALTTLTGLGVLIFAKHPALQSIATLAIVGIISVLVVSFTLQPILFNSLIQVKDKKRQIPLSLINFILSNLYFLIYASMALFLTTLIPVISILPVKKVRKKYLLRYIIHSFLRAYLYLYPTLRIKLQGINKNSFKTPSIIISNHQSMVDILLYLALSPNILILVKDWVWNSPIFGALVRYCSHIRITKGYDNAIADIKTQVENGCSVLVFPEGSRSKDGKIARFHKGGFYIAQKLGLPIQPILVHGVWKVLSRDSFIINPGQITMQALSKFQIEEKNERAYYYSSKETCEMMRIKYKELDAVSSTPEYFRYRIAANYFYKGPILENYIKIKLRLEDSYNTFHSLIPRKAKITDIGCGYGTMAFSLSLCSHLRKITAIDYDENKIMTAKNCELNSHCDIHFISADVVNYNYLPSDVFIISDVLHYLTPKDQKEMLVHCIKKLNDKGKIIIRDSDLSLKNRHYGTQLSEFLSTSIGFNKKKNKLSFISREFVEKIATDNKLDIQILDRSTLTSNLIYILEKYSHEE